MPTTRIGGHAAVATAILEDVALARLVKQAGYRLQFRVSDVVRTRMYRSFPQMWEGWTKNLALLFPHPRRLAVLRLAEFAIIVLRRRARRTHGDERRNRRRSGSRGGGSALPGFLSITYSTCAF